MLATQSQRQLRHRHQLLPQMPRCQRQRMGGAQSALKARLQQQSRTRQRTRRQRQCLLQMLKQALHQQCPRRVLRQRPLLGALHAAQQQKKLRRRRISRRQQRSRKTLRRRQLSGASYTAQQSRVRQWNLPQRLLRHRLQPLSLSGAQPAQLARSPQRLLQNRHPPSPPGAQLSQRRLRRRRQPLSRRGAQPAQLARERQHQRRRQPSSPGV